MVKTTKKADQKKAVDAILPEREKETEKLPIETRIDTCESKIHDMQIVTSELAKTFKRYAEANSRQLTKIKGEKNDGTKQIDDVANDVNILYTVVHDQMNNLEKIQATQTRIIAAMIFTNVLIVLLAAFRISGVL